MPTDSNYREYTMTQKRFTGEQIESILQHAEHDNMPVSEICLEQNISASTFHRWRSQYGYIGNLHACQCANCQQEDDHPDKDLHRQMNLLCACLNNQQRRLYAAVEANRIGRGGVAKVTQILGITRDPIRKGRQELVSKIRRTIDQPEHRAKGAGRLTSEQKHPALLALMEELLDCEAAGEPHKKCKWIRSSTSRLAEQLKDHGYNLHQTTIWRMLKRMGYSMRINLRKRRGYAGNADKRDEQFAYLASQREIFTEKEWPIISVDAKKKELIGNFKRSGRTWCKEAEEVNEYDFPSLAICKAVPYGVYDVTKNRGFVYVGTSGNTAEFAVDAIVRWWEEEGKETYPDAKSLLILADGGGSNGHRSRAWKKELQMKLCDRSGLSVTICHYPTRCSKWNPIERRLFNHITMNWSGKPLRSLEMLLGYIRGTTTNTGLTVKAFLQEGVYEKGQVITKQEMGALALEPHAICPDWNYTINPCHPVQVDHVSSSMSTRKVTDIRRGQVEDS